MEFHFSTARDHTIQVLILEQGRKSRKVRLGSDAWYNLSLVLRRSIIREVEVYAREMIRGVDDLVDRHKQDEMF